MQTIAMGRLMRGILKGGQARVLLCDTRDMTQAARETHQASNVCTAALGRGIGAAALLAAASEKEAVSLTLTIKGNGPAGSLVVVTRERTVKAYIDHPQIELPLRADGKLDVGSAIGGSGRLTVVRDLGMREPYIGQVALQSGEIAEDIAFYCTKSEQQPSLCALGEQMTDTLISSGGLLIQAMPGCEDETLSALEMRAPVFADVSAHLAHDPMEALFAGFFRDLDPEILADEVLTYACDCTRERMERVLISLGREELTDMIEKERGAEITCNFCRTSHAFSEQELRTLLEQAGAGQGQG